MEPVRSAPRLIRLLGLGGLAALAAVLARMHLPLCPTAFLFHVPCPSCGLTRAALLLVQGDVRGAYALHPLSPLLVPLTIALAGRAALYDRPVGSREAPARRSGPTESAPPEKGTWHVRLWHLSMTLVWLALILTWLARFFGAFGGPVPVTSL